MNQHMIKRWDILVLAQVQVYPQMALRPWPCRRGTKTGQAQALQEMLIIISNFHNYVPTIYDNSLSLLLFILDYFLVLLLFV